MKIIKSYLTNNPCYKEGRKIKVSGLMLHSVGVNQPNASVFINQWNKESYGDACVHAFIEGSGNVYQTLPWNMRGWHCGGSGNDTHIGVEMCEPSQLNYSGGDRFTVSDREAAVEYVNSAYNTAVELFAYLCREYGLNPLTQICSHNEGYDMGIATNHSDPEHLWRGLGMAYTMDGFRRAVKSKMTSEDQNPPDAVSDSYLVKITADVLNVRTGPGVKHPVVQTVKENEVFTVIDENSGWGKLKSGAGWISLEYTQKYTAGGFNAYLVKVTADVLNVRKQPSENSEIATTVKKNEIFTVVDEKNGWGKLKSGAGWINLDYIMRV